jgi:NAD(P)-dependent dehydrogenase (short-subunit alcohol dehydrogenase family)
MSDASRNIVMTGVSRGLGRALVAELVAAGHTVYGCARSASAVDQLQSQCGRPHAFVALDVTDDAQVAHWAEDVLAAAGPPDLLLNNAGMINENAPLWEVPADEFSRVIDTNINGVVNVIRQFVPSMVERASGVIVNFSSGWGRNASPNVAPYCATKWAMEGMTRALAQELPDGMAAVPLDPGIINTDMLASAFGDNAEKFPNAQQWARIAMPFLLNLGPDDNGEPHAIPKPE